MPRLDRGTLDPCDGCGKVTRPATFLRGKSYRGAMRYCAGCLRDHVVELVMKDSGLTPGETIYQERHQYVLSRYREPGTRPCVQCGHEISYTTRDPNVPAEPLLEHQPEPYVCSHRCNLLWGREKAPYPYAERECAFCGMSFVPSQESALYHHPRCRDRAAYRRRKQRAKAKEAA